MNLQRIWTALTDLRRNHARIGCLHRGMVQNKRCESFLRTFGVIAGLRNKAWGSWHTSSSSCLLVQFRQQESLAVAIRYTINACQITASIQACYSIVVRVQILPVLRDWLELLSCSWLNRRGNGPSPCHEASFGRSEFNIAHRMVTNLEKSWDSCVSMTGSFWQWRCFLNATKMSSKLWLSINQTSKYKNVFERMSVSEKRVKSPRWN